MLHLKKGCRAKCTTIITSRRQSAPAVVEPTATAIVVRTAQAQELLPHRELSQV